MFKLHQKNVERNRPANSPQRTMSFTSFHVSFRLHAFPGTTCPGLCGSSVPPSPLPSTSSFVDLGEHTLRSVQPTPTPPQLEATLHNFSVSARSTKACSTAALDHAGLTSPPRRSHPDLEAKPHFFWRSAVALVPVRPTSTTRTVSSGC